MPLDKSVTEMSSYSLAGSVLDISAIAGTRKQWSTPRVIVSESRSTQAQVAAATDGSSTFYGPYGS